MKNILPSFSYSFFCLILLVIASCCSDKNTELKKAPAGEITSVGITANYPNDNGIENDPNVFYTEMFDDGIENILRRYSDVYNGEGMSTDGDVPIPVPGSRSLKMTNTGGKNTGGHLFKIFPAGYDSIFVRYYVKYPSSSKGFIHHEGIWFGGYNPSTSYPNPRAGVCSLGSERISVAYEPVNGKMGSYLYWGEMQSSPDGHCWGNDMVNGNPGAQNIQWDEWTCIEIMIKLNNPLSSSNGEMRIWQNGVEVGYWGEGFPNGTSTYGKFTENTNGQPFKGFRWRTDEKLKINYVWIEFYDDTTPENESHYIQFDNLVMAGKYIGPIKH